MPEWRDGPTGKDPVTATIGMGGLCNATALRKAMRRVTLLYDTALAPCGLRSTQRTILMQIARLDSPSMGDLAASLVLDRSALAHNLRPLERDGLVETVVDMHDKRSRVVSLTQAGRAKLGESAPMWEEAQRRFEATFGADRARDLRDTLAVVASSEFNGVDLDAEGRVERRSGGRSRRDAAAGARSVGLARLGRDPRP